MSRLSSGAEAWHVPSSTLWRFGRRLRVASSSRPTHCLVTPLLMRCIARWVSKKERALFTSVDVWMIPAIGLSDRRLATSLSQGGKSMIGINQFRLSSANLRVAQLHR
jgi:hypothetical protein